MTNIHHLASRSNSGLKTHDGLILMGNRLAKEVIEYIQSEIFHSTSKNDKVFVSFVGHSLGGLIAKVAARLLFGKDSHLSIHGAIPNLSLDIIPCSFITLCTPHLGARKWTDSSASLLDSKKWFHHLVMTYAKNVLGKTGVELMLEDRMHSSDPSNDEQEPILYQLANENLEFVKATSQFRCTAMACLFYDLPVGYCSAAISLKHPDPSFVNACSLLEEDHPKSSSKSVRFHVHSIHEPQINQPSNASFQQLIEKWKSQHFIKEIQSDDLFISNATDSDPSSAIYIPDDIYELETSTRLLTYWHKHVQQWRRINVHYHLQTSSMTFPFIRNFVHPFLPGKPFWFLSSDVKEMVKMSCDCVVNVILSDYLDLK